MQEPTDHQILTTMRQYGGGFSKQLALAGFCADSENLARLKKAFPELWADNAILWKVIKKREAEKPQISDS